MTRRSKIWRVLAALFVFINLAGFGYAVALGQMLHAAVHVGLLAAGYLVWSLVARAPRQDLARAHQADERIEYLQRSVDAIALEVERIGEAQRFSDKLRAEQAETSPLKQDQQRTS
jgi:hypothetical protein